MLLLLICVSMTAFFLVSLSPVDPLQANVGQAALGSMSQEQIAKLESYWGVGEPPVERFLSWASDFFRGDMTSDLLAGGDSARLVQRLVRERRLAASANAYVSGSVDPGLFVVTAQLLPDTAVEQAEAALWEELALLSREAADPYETEKVKNRFEANTLFGELNVMNKAMNLGFYEMLGDLPLINRETELYRSLTPDELIEFSRATFRTENSSTLIYKAKK